MPSKKIDLERSLEELEKLVAELEGGKLGLDQSLKNFEEGVSIYKDCKSVLDGAEKQIRILNDQLREENLENG